MIPSEFRVSSITLAAAALEMRNKTIIFNASEHDKHRGKYCIKCFNAFQLSYLKSPPTVNLVSYHLTFNYLKTPTQKSQLNVQTE